MNPKLIISLAGAFCVMQSSAFPVQVFFSDFDSGVPVEISGETNIEAVQGYAGVGPAGNQFSGDFLRNFTGGPSGEPGAITSLTLSGLAPHTSVQLHFLLAIIDSWDGSSDIDAPDFFNIAIDGTTIFSETFDNFVSADQSFVPPPGALLTPREFIDLGFNSGFPDAAYAMALNIPHTASSLTVEFWASGAGWQAGADESWAIDNLRVFLNADVPEAGSSLVLLALALASLAFASRQP